MKKLFASSKAILATKTGHSAPYSLELLIDSEALFRKLAVKAANNKSGKCVLAGGLIVIKATRKE